MVEPYGVPTYGNLTSAQTPHWWQNEPFPKTERNDSTNHQFSDSEDDDDDDVKFVRLVKPAPTRLAQTVDLNESIFDVTNDAGPSRLAETVDLKRSIFDFVNGNDVAKDSLHSLSNRHTRQTVTTGQFEHDNNVALPNPFSQTLPKITKPKNIQNIDANASNGTLNGVDWLKATDALKQLFGNRKIEPIPNTIVSVPAPATSTNTVNDSKWKDVFEEGKQTLAATNNPQPGPSRPNVGFFAPYMTNAPAYVANNEPNRLAALFGDTSVQPEQLTLAPPRPSLFVPYRNQPGPFGHHLGNLPTSLPEQNQPEPFAPQQAIPPTAIPFPPQQNETVPYVPQRAIPPIPPIRLPGYDKAIQEIIQREKAFVGALIPNRYHPANGPYPAQYNPTIINENMKRKRVIPIKVVRSTKQYETLVDMGFPKKDIETALRKCDLDLYETIEYLSEDKRAAKRRKKEQNTTDLFNADNAYQSQQSHEEPTKVNAEPIRKPANLYEELLYLEETGGAVKSIESFDCEICLETIEIKDGLILRNCLHRYCNDCLNGTIVHSEEIAIKCPYVGCEETLQDREIRAVLSQDEYEKFLMKGVRVAQVTISGTILCNLPDCNGWCICEDIVNEFKCPQCKNINCIPCKAIHPERNCREYQDDLAAGDASGIISGQRRSEQAIQELINKNEAMKCFQCGILIMKRDGCDYIQCVMCKAGICWATRGPRYGPGGVGDFSGGCGCTAQKRCHKDCRGCH